MVDVTGAAKAIRDTAEEQGEGEGDGGHAPAHGQRGPHKDLANGPLPADLQVQGNGA